MNMMKNQLNGSFQVMTSEKILNSKFDLKSEL